MKLGFHRHGKQFFFYTACLEGRPQMLSRLEEGAKWPLLSPVGEGVKAALLAVHGQNPALTMSDFVIMPDHVHFFLIVDFDRDPAFDPISFIHEWMAAAAEAGQRAGGPAPEPPPLMGAGRLLPGRSTPGGSGGGKPPGRLVWEKGFWISLAWYAPQRKAIRLYIRNNPARALWKRAHPDRFRVMAGIRHSSLDPALRWSAMGDATLIASPFRFPVRLTRHRDIEGQKEQLDEAMERARRGMVPVCGFISPAEHELERRLRAEPSARWIKAVPHGLRPGYDPSVEDSRALAGGRLLLLSSFAPDVPVSPISRDNCNLMNERILALCGEAADPIQTFRA